jgi:hypothetical protein
MCKDEAQQWNEMKSIRQVVGGGQGITDGFKSTVM